MRIYHFGNFYMSSIQQGIQAAHAQMEMFVKYNNYGEEEHQATGMLFEWARNHQTMICLNGGMDTNLQDIKRLMAQPENPYPWSSFNESGEAMNHMLTNVAIVLPERIYETAKIVRERTHYFSGLDLVLKALGKSNSFSSLDEKINTFTQFEIDLINLLNSCSLAK